jgi:hypothetical protein
MTDIAIRVQVLKGYGVYGIVPPDCACLPAALQAGPHADRLLHTFNMSRKSIVRPDLTCEWKKGAIPPKWNGQAAGRVVEHLEGFCHDLKQPPVEPAINGVFSNPEMSLNEGRRI